MNRRKKVLILIIIILFTATAVFAVSATVKANKDYRLTLHTLRQINIMVQNFPNNGKNKEYERLKELFQTAGEELYGRNFSSAFQKFNTTKNEMIVFLEKLSKEYLERTKSILDSTSKISFDILIKYGKNSPYIIYYKKPYDPLFGIEPYNESFQRKDYHFFRDKETIERYLQNGYKHYQFAKNLFEDPEIEYLKNRKNRTSSNVDYILKNYMNVILTCRQAKQCGIEIHKILNIHQVVDILTKYNITADQLTPIYDDRIPAQYKVDAVDNKELIHEVEKKRILNKK